MSVAASWALQQAVHAALVADPDVAASVGARVYDDVPQDAAFPYITLGEASVRDWSTGSDTGAEHRLTLHVWSRAQGRKEIKEISGVVSDALDEAALTVTGTRLVNLRFVSADMLRDADGETYHGILRFRAVTEPL